MAGSPFGVFHDLRWLLVYHPSWTAFAFEWIFVLGVRTLLETALTRAAWPSGVPLPPFREHVRRVSGFVVLQAVVLLPLAVLLFGMAVTSLSWLFFVAVPVVLFVSLLVHHGAVEPRWLRAAPSRASVTATLWTFVTISVAGALIAIAPTGLEPVIAAAAGAVFGLLRVQLVTTLACREVEPRRWPFAVVGLAGVLALVVVGTILGFVVAIAVESARGPAERVPDDGDGVPVLIVKGFNSDWDGVNRHWVRGDVRIRRFSYAGLDDDGDPRAYARAATHASIRALVLRMREQVRAFRRASDADVAIVAESEGSLVAQAYLASTPDAPVRALVLLSPLLEPGRVYYPHLPSDGWGVAGGTLLDGLTTALGWVSPVDVSANTPLFRSMVDEEPALGALLSCPPPDVRSLAILPLDSGVSAPAIADVGFAHAVLPAFHGGLLGDGAAQDLIARVLRDRPVRRSGFWETVGDVVNVGAAAWQAPSLDRSLEPSWDADAHADDCRTVRARLRAWLD